MAAVAKVLMRRRMVSVFMEVISRTVARFLNMRGAGRQFRLRVLRGGVIKVCQRRVG
jgi:hypothetical protein